MYLKFFKVTRPSEGLSLHLPFYKLYTATIISNEAIFTASFSSATTVALTYAAGGIHNGRLFRLPLMAADILESGADIVAVIAVGLDREARIGDNDPRFFLSDGTTGIGFEMQDGIGNRCRGVQAIMGDTLTSLGVISGAPHISSTLPEEFVLTIKLRRQWGSCFTSVDSGVISPVQYTRTVFPNRGLWLEVYRQNTGETYSFNYIKVELHVEN